MDLFLYCPYYSTCLKKHNIVVRFYTMNNMIQLVHEMFSLPPPNPVLETNIYNSLPVFVSTLLQLHTGRGDYLQGQGDLIIKIMLRLDGAVFQFQDPGRFSFISVKYRQFDKSVAWSSRWRLHIHYSLDF